MSRTAQRREPADVPAPASRFRIGQRVIHRDDPTDIGIVTAIYHAGIITVEWSEVDGLPATSHNHHESFLLPVEAAE